MKQNPRQTFDLTIHSHIHVKEGETVVHVQHNKRDLDAGVGHIAAYDSRNLGTR